MAKKGNKSYNNTMSDILSINAKVTASIIKLYSTTKVGSKEFEEGLQKLKKEAEDANKKIEALTSGHKELGESQEKATASTKGLLRGLMTLELSLHRIQRGFNGLKNTAMFAEKAQKDILQFAQLARSIDSSAEALKGLDRAGRTFGLGFGEASGLIKTLKTNLADLRWGGSGGGIGQLMSRWGGNFTGYESEKEMLTKLREVYMRVRPEDRVLVSRDIGASDAMQDFLTNFNTTEEFEAYLDKYKIDSLDKAEAEARKGMVAQGEKQNSLESKDISVMENLGVVTTSTNKILADIYKYMGDNPWLSATKLGVDVLGSAGSLAFGIGSIANVLKIGRAASAATAATGAATAVGGAGAAAATGGAVAGAMPAIIGIASALAVIAGGWYAVKKIEEHLQDKSRGKREDETDSDFEKRVALERAAYVAQRARERREMEESGSGTSEELFKHDAETQKHLREMDAEAEKNRATIKANNALIEKQQGIIDKLKKSEIVPDSELAILTAQSGNPEKNKEITDQLGGTRDLGIIKQRMLASSVANSKPDDFLANQVAKYVREGKIGHLKDVFKTENVGKLDNKQWELFADYIGKSIVLKDRLNLQKFVKDAPSGYAVPSDIAKKSKDWDERRGNAYEFFDSGMGFGFDKPAAVVDRGGETKDGAEILTKIYEYSKKPFAERAYQRSVEGRDAIKKAQDAIKETAKQVQGFGSTTPEQIEAPMLSPEVLAGVKERMDGAFSKVGDANEMADEAQSRGDIVNNTTHNTTNNNEINTPIKNEIHITQNLQAPEDAGRMLDSTVREVGKWTDPFETNPWLKDIREAGQNFGTGIEK